MKKLIFTAAAVFITGMLLMPNTSISNKTSSNKIARIIFDTRGCTVLATAD